MLRSVPALVALAALALSACRPAPDGPARPSKNQDRPPPISKRAPALDEINPNFPFAGSPVKPELRLDEAQQRAVLTSLRAACDGKPQDAGELSGISAPLVVVVYDEDGGRLDSVRLEEAPLADNVKRAADKLCSSSSAKKGFLHALVVSYTARLPNFGLKGVFDNKVFEPQVNGLAYEIGTRREELDPLEQLERNQGSKMARAALASRVGIDAQTMPARNDLTVEIYRTIHVGERYPDRAFQQFLRGHKVLDHEEVTHELLAERLKLIGQWYKANVRGGQVVYEYSTSGGSYRERDRTMIRSTMSAWILNRLAVYLADDELKKLGAEVIDHYFDTWFQMDASKKAGKLVPSLDPIASGNIVEHRWTSASFMAAACNEREDKARYEQEMNLLLDWAMGHLRDDGVYWTTYGQGQYFMPGQLLLVVSYFFRDTGDEKYRKHFDKALDVYEPALYHMMHLGPQWHTPYAPAWFTQPLTQMYLVTGDDRYKDLVFAINDRVLHAYDINRRYQVYPDYDGMLAPKPNSYGNNSITAASLEALTDAAIVAKKAGDADRLARYQHVIKRAVAFLLRLQWVPENTYYFKNRERVIGGFKRDMLNTVSWMDSVWHLTSAFMKIQQHKLLEPAAPAAAPTE
jgi:hypothetical protein